MRRALITGVTGQDGRYLAELLVAKGYAVHGLIRGQANPKRELVANEIPELEFVDGDLTDQGSLISAVAEVQPDEVYNLGAISFVPLSWREPEHTFQVTGGGPLRMLEAIRIVGGQRGNPIRFYQASSSEMFGKVDEVPQNERTRFHPRSPYGVAKAYGHYLTRNYRESYGFHASSGISFNHESPRRGLEFVTRKVTNAVARIQLGLQPELVLGNLDVSRDWGFAGDHVEAMWLMLQQERPGDYVVATGETHSVRELVELAFGLVGVDLEWVGSGVEEVGSSASTGETLVRIDPRFFRPAEVDLLIGDSWRARQLLGWSPRVGFRELVELMLRADLEREATHRPGRLAPAHAAA
jgi:GDPmannose 4,6-dehydratase